MRLNRTWSDKTIRMELHKQACSGGTEIKKSCCAPSSGHQTRPEDSDLGSKISPEVAAALHLRMIELPGGSFLMGTDTTEGFPQDGEGPIREVCLDPYSIDKYPVTNDDFSQFVQATKYRTDAERFGWSFVFWTHISRKRFDEIVEDQVIGAPWWCKVRGARWDQPEGPGSHIRGRGKHPVVHVSWHDAVAFAAWTRRRLPTEAEWEYAARGGLVGKLYPWGDKLRSGGKHLCNIWQGKFPIEDTAEDGYAGTCPVDAFPPNAFGLFSVTGNTWEWCADWFDAEFHRTADHRNPQGPPQGTARVMKGGSFLCHKSYCNRYRVAARSSNTPDSSTANIGFRCAL